MNTPHPEFAPDPSSLETRFKVLIDAKFAIGTPHPSRLREHEEEIGLLPVKPLSLCPTATGFRLTRPIPEEAELARAKWDQYGGHLVQAIEVSHQPHGSSSKETDFFAIGDTMYARKVHIVPGESIEAPIEALSDEATQEVWGWVETAVPEP